VGSRLPAYCTSMGRVLLAALPAEELELGLRSIAIPVTARSGRVAAAMNSGVSAARVSREELKQRILPALTECGRLLGQLLA
jgi:IclR family transcriptional regulator, pca regulon regulatory protein